ncbi:hypothetical protein Acr_22g0006710 [Actinidia rufa]|uniref:Transmembrane protein n=1 Tax=Actinidia rufa TaxID=165716 RepID=A0A7J0GKE0_9ERIC|nr:hypothetical protein Acr_22g0006710 [Actinidia rufa]
MWAACFLSGLLSSFDGAPLVALFGLLAPLGLIIPLVLAVVGLIILAVITLVTVIVFSSGSRDSGGGARGPWICTHCGSQMNTSYSWPLNLMSLLLSRKPVLPPRVTIPSSWVIDSGASIHITGTFSIISDIFPIGHPSRVTLVDGSTSYVTSSDTASLWLKRDTSVTLFLFGIIVYGDITFNETPKAYFPSPSSPSDPSHYLPTRVPSVSGLPGVSVPSEKPLQVYVRRKKLSVAQLPIPLPFASTSFTLVDSTSVDAWIDPASLLIALRKGKRYVSLIPLLS